MFGAPVRRAGARAEQRVRTARRPILELEGVSARAIGHG